MSPLKTLTLIFLCSVAFLSKIYAQKDYIIKLNNDTIYCKIRGGLNTRLRYRVNKDDKFTRINPDSVTQYFLADDSSSYIVKDIPEKKIRTYVKWLERGHINLYQYTVYYSTGNYSNSEDFYYASNGEDSLIEIKHYSFSIIGLAHSQKKEKQAFANLFSGDTAIQDTLLKLPDYNIITIEEFVRRYNIKHFKEDKAAK